MLIIGFAAAAIAMVIFLSDDSNLLLGALCLLLVALYFIYPRPIMFYLACGFGGAIAEVVAIHYGKKTWTYVEPAPSMNIPLWLIPLWALVGTCLVELEHVFTSVRGVLKERLDLHLDGLI